MKIFEILIQIGEFWPSKHTKKEEEKKQENSFPLFATMIL
jgi:hypothetical protein